MIQVTKGFLRKITLFFRRPLPAKIIHVSIGVLKYVFFAFVVFLLYLPILIIAVQSFNDSRNFYDFTFFSLRWYEELFSGISLANPSELGSAIQTTLLIAFTSTIISTIFGTLFSIGIHSMSKKSRQKMMFLNQVPILNADIVTGVSLMLIFRLIWLAIPQIIGYPSLLLAHVFFSLPYVVLSVLPKLSELDENLYDAALDLGCKPFRGMTKVIIPAISSGIFTGMLIAFTMSIDDFVISFFTTGPGINTVATYIYSSAQRMNPASYSYNTLLSTIVVVILVLFSIISSVRKKMSMSKNSIHKNIKKGAVYR